MPSSSVCLSLPDCLHSPWHSLGPSTWLQMALFPSFSCGVISHCLNIPQLLYPLISRWTGCALVLAIVYSTVVNIGVHVVLGLQFLCALNTRSRYHFKMRESWNSLLPSPRVSNYLYFARFAFLFSPSISLHFFSWNTPILQMGKLRPRSYFWRLPPRSHTRGPEPEIYKLDKGLQRYLKPELTSRSTPEHQKTTANSKLMCLIQCP